MSVTLTIRDETASGEVYHEVPLEFPSECITIHDLIRERVYQEVQDFNLKQGERVFRGLVQPTDTEGVLNERRIEFRLREHRQLEWKAQFEKAVVAFESNGFFILIDDKQAESLKQEFTITRGTRVSFVKLIPLVGG